MLQSKSSLKIKNVKISSRLEKERKLCSNYLSKNNLRNSNPDDIVYYNINILNKKGDILWSGNINITTKFENLYDLSNEIGGLYICDKNKNYKTNSYLSI